MNEIRTKLGQNGRIVIPATFRKALGLESGVELMMRIEDGEVRILSRERAIRRAQEAVGRYVREDESLSEKLIAERRAEAKRG